MKNNAGFIGVLLLILPGIAFASCESLKAKISAKIIKNGVPAKNFSLQIMPNDQAENARGLVVGHCNNDTQKIVYYRHSTPHHSSSAASVVKKKGK